MTRSVLDMNFDVMDMDFSDDSFDELLSRAAHEAPKHSILGASSMYRWSACPGSVRLCKGVPETKSKAAQKGTDAHASAEEILIKRFLSPDATAESFWKLDEDTRRAVNLYCETISFDYLGERWPAVISKDGREIHIEVKVNLDSIYPGCFGTSDAVIWLPSEKLLRVYDYKNGVMAIPVEGNQQAQYYALGALLKFKYPAKEIEMVIVQPNASKTKPVKRWRVPVTQVSKAFRKELVDACKRTEDPNAPLNPGRHCYFCPAKGFCPARHQQALSTAALEFSSIDDIMS